MQIVAIEEMLSTTTEKGNGTGTGIEKKTGTRKAEETKIHIGTEKGEGTKILAETRNGKDEGTGKMKVGTQMTHRRGEELKEIKEKETELRRIGPKRMMIEREGGINMGREVKENQERQGMMKAERERRIGQKARGMRGTERGEEKKMVVAEINLQRR